MIKIEFDIRKGMHIETDGDPEKIIGELGVAALKTLKMIASDDDDFRKIVHSFAISLKQIAERKCEI